MSVLGVDVGAGTVKSGVFAPKVPPTAVACVETARTYDGLLAQLGGIIAAARRDHGVQAAGVGVPGFISRPEGVVERSPNLRFLDGAPLERDLAVAAGLPLAVENDANAAALGEYRALPRPRPASFVHLTLGSGVGAGIVLAGRLYRGSSGFAAELGHLLVNGRGRPCGCGNSGCAESECSEAGIVASYRERTGTAEALSSRQVFDRLQGGDPAAAGAFRRAGRFLGVLLAQIVYALNPSHISIGGGVAAAGEALLAPAREELARRVVPRALAGTVLAAARLGNGAGMAGAAALAGEARAAAARRRRRTA